MTKYADRDLGILEDLLDGSREGDDRRLVMISSPEIDITVSVALYFPASIVQPGVDGVRTAAQVGK